MKILKETLWDKLANRLPANDARREARVLKRAGCLATPDYLDVKAMSEVMEDCREKTWEALKDYRRWQLQESARHLSATVRQREGELLKQRALDCAGLYWDARRDYADLIELALRPYKAMANDNRTI